MITINGRKIGEGEPCYIVAEAGVNHNGDLSLARKLVHLAARCGADCVKFQTFSVEHLVAPGHPQRELLTPLALPASAFAELKALALKEGLAFLSTPFDEPSVALLRRLGVPAWKIASGELTNLPLLERIASFGQPMLVSTGMSSLAEVEQAVEVIERADNHQIVLLHCTSAYPTPVEEVNLKAMLTLRQAFGYPVGLSDHSMVEETGVAAVALGAVVIEKHLTLDRTLPGPDHETSLEPSQFDDMVQAIRNVERALGDGRKRPSASELPTREVARKSLFAARDIPAGQLLTRENTVFQRPGTGLGPEEI